MSERLARPFAWLLVLVAGCATAALPTGVETASASGLSAPTQLVDLTNGERSQAGLQPFTRSPRLMHAAQIQADQMAAVGHMAHRLPSATYPDPADRLSAVGYTWSAYAENVAYGQSSPAAVLDAWMHSSGHRANILNPGLTELGTGYARDTDGRLYWVQVFGHPR